MKNKYNKRDKANTELPSVVPVMGEPETVFEMVNKFLP